MHGMALRILTLNIWHDAGPWKQRAERIRAWIDATDPDLIALQEVLRGPQIDQLAELFDGRGYQTEFIRASAFWNAQEVDFGNAIASRFPISERHPLLLPDHGDGEQRAALSVRIDAPVGPVLFTCTHLNWKFHHGETRERQVRALAEHVLSLRDKGGFPPVLAGDFNAEPESDEIRFLTGLHSIEGLSVYFHDAWYVAGEGTPGVTWSNRNPYARAALEPDRRIDYVFTGYPTRDGVGLLERCRVVCDDDHADVWPSDHFGVFAELRTEPLDGAFSLR